MKVLLGFILFVVITFSGLYLAGFIWSVLEPVLTHPITVTVFLTFVLVMFLNIYKRGSNE